MPLLLLAGILAVNGSAEPSHLAESRGDKGRRAEEPAKGRGSFPLRWMDEPELPALDYRTDALLDQLFQVNRLLDKTNPYGLTRLPSIALLNYFPSRKLSRFNGSITREAVVVSLVEAMVKDFRISKPRALDFLKGAQNDQLRVPFDPASEKRARAWVVKLFERRRKQLVSLAEKHNREVAADLDRYERYAKTARERLHRASDKKNNPLANSIVLFQAGAADIIDTLRQAGKLTDVDRKFLLSWPVGDRKKEGEALMKKYHAALLANKAAYDRESHMNSRDPRKQLREANQKLDELKGKAAPLGFGIAAGRAAELVLSLGAGPGWGSSIDTSIGAGQRPEMPRGPVGFLLGPALLARERRFDKLDTEIHYWENLARQYRAEIAADGE